MGYGSSAVRGDDQGAFAAQVVDQKLEESVDGEGLVDVADGIDELRGGRGDQADPRGYCVNGDPES